MSPVTDWNPEVGAVESLVIYATRTGNTRRIAESIAEALRAYGPVHLRSVEECTAAPLPAADLLVIGGPTEGHGMTEAMIACLDHLEATPIDGRPIAVFDTRLWWPKALSGSAADRIAERVQRRGARLVVPPESFIVTMKPELQPGEVDRARTWGAAIGTAVGGPAPTEPVGV